MRVVRGVIVSAVIVSCAPSVLRAQTLVWDPSSDASVTGYRVVYGTQTGIYANQVDVGNVVSYQPSGFDWSITRYFAVLSYNSSGATSSLSNEVQWVPTKVTSIQASASYPLLARRTVTWTATATASVPLEYRFWLYRKTGWTLAQDYSASNTFTWTPTQADAGAPYSVQVWARAVGSSVQYESYLGTPSFSVAVLPFELVANVDFPTPPGNEVTWTALVDAAPPLEYRFLVNASPSPDWTVFREYATSNVATWTPTANGFYAIQGWARAVGSTAQYEYVGTTNYFTVSQSPLTVTGLTSNVASPATTGTAIKWTARVKGGSSGPIQYQFSLYSPTSGWNVVQPYGPSETYTWTPTWGSEGDYQVQVSVRSNGSTANYEDSRVSDTFTVQPASMKLTTDTLFPVAPGSMVDWTADIPDPTANFEYEFWIYSVATGSWSLGKTYGAAHTFRWIPANAGSYFIQAWARQVGSTLAYEVFRSTNQLVVSQGPAQLVSLTSNVSLPATAGTTITWTAAASGGTAGPLQYQFWRWDSTGWVMVQNYGPLNSYSWTPTAGDVGDHALQVWVRSAGSSVAYESYKSSGIFSIN